MGRIRAPKGLYTEVHMVLQSPSNVLTHISENAISVTVVTVLMEAYPQ